MSLNSTTPAVEGHACEKAKKYRPPFDFIRTLEKHGKYGGYGLALPNKLNRYLETFSGEVTVRIAGGPLWRLGLVEESGGRLELRCGWKTFVLHYRIHDEYLISFTYRGDMHFEVKVFDYSLINIEYYVLDFRCSCFSSSANANLEESDDLFTGNDLEPTGEELETALACIRELEDKYSLSWYQARWENRRELWAAGHAVECVDDWDDLMVESFAMEDRLSKIESRLTKIRSSRSD